jgi:hypothetical protein
MTNQNQLYPLKKKFVPVIEIEALSYAGWEQLGIGLDRYIAQCYGLPKVFEITDAKNDTEHRFEVAPLDPEGSMYKWDSEDAQKAIDQGWCEIWSLGSLLCKMASDGYLQPGVYLVNVSW